MSSIIEVSGDLLDITSGMIIHGCNAQGVMGSGIALQLKNKHPGMFSTYVNDVNLWSQKGTRRHDCLGAVSWYVEDDLVIGSCITQLFYGKDGALYVSYDAVDSCAMDVNAMLKSGEFTELHIPKIGAGLGGGSWSVISEILTHRIEVPIICWVKE